MNTTLTHRNIFAALVLVPAMALTGVMAESLAGQSAAFAQQTGRGQGPSDSGPRGEKGDIDFTRGLRPCPPGAPGSNCEPWTPPRFTAKSEEECGCHVTYSTVNGQRIATKDCYVLLPNNKVHYCQADTTIR
ncbi:MAG: hypothetical protein CL534_13485 [Ahrensia sp.]|nr:hypothetical protein [Ahrensia sp.]